MLVTELGITSSPVKPEQPANAPEFIEVTVLGITRSPVNVL
jgi:hypothetical protein